MLIKVIKQYSNNANVFLKIIVICSMVSVSNAMKTLQISPVLLNITSLRTIDECRVRLEYIKLLARKNHRRLAKKYHPDRTKEKSSDEFRQVDGAHKLIKSLSIQKHNNINIRINVKKSVGIVVNLGGSSVGLQQPSFYKFTINN